MKEKSKDEGEKHIEILEQMLAHRPMGKVKIIGDGGIYEVYGIDWLHTKILVDRACGFEWVYFYKCKVK